MITRPLSVQTTIPQGSRLEARGRLLRTLYESGEVGSTFWVFQLAGSSCSIIGGSHLAVRAPFTEVWECW